MARYIIISGIVITIIGVVMYFAPWLINWFGKLPGDINIETKRSKIFVPLTSMFLVSIFITVVIRIIRRFIT